MRVVCLETGKKKRKERDNTKPLFNSPLGQTVPHIPAVQPRSPGQRRGPILCVWPGEEAQQGGRSNEPNSCLTGFHFATFTIDPLAHC